MAYSTTNLYPEDLYGTNPANLITNEPQTLQTPGPTDFYFIIPKAAPFFVDSLKVINAANGQPYVEGDDYQIGHLFVEAMDSIGRPIAGSIRFMRPTITGQVLLTYRTIGGPWGFSDQDILRELSNKQVNPLIRSWGDIAPLPYAFPPLPHDQRINTLIGSKELNDSLKHIADVLEATAAGTTESHLVDYNNPHRVTATQVGLGNVPNFSMATEQQHLDATATNLFTNPRGVRAMINLFAVDPLNAHINAKGNVHDLTAAELGLGNVPNWLPATATTALDPTNNSSFMTPYTTTLLLQKSMNDPRLDQLIIDFNEHLTANNPHHITPEMIGTYTSAQIDQMIRQASGGGDAATFNGETPTEWEAKFPSADDLNTILDELASTYQTETVKLTQLDAEDPITEQQRNERNARRIGSAFGSYGAYGLYNTYNDLRLVFDPTVVGGELPTKVVLNGAMRWASAQNASYYVKDDGSIDTGGSEAITIPVGYASGAGFVPANASKHVFTSKDYLYVHRTDNKLMLLVRGATAFTEIGTYPEIDNLYTNNGLQDPRVFSVVRTPIDDDTFDWSPIGDASWVTAANAIKSRASSQGYTVVDTRVGTEYFNVIVTKANVYTLWIYKINYGAQITMTDVTATTDIMNHTTGVSAKANTVVGITQLAGSYNHFVFTQPIPGAGEQGGNGEPEDLCLLYSFGDNSNGQLEITSASGPFFAVGAGFGYTVTINKQHFAEFWGDSPNNSLIYTGGSLILPPTP